MQLSSWILSQQVFVQVAQSRLWHTTHHNAGDALLTFRDEYPLVPRDKEPWYPLGCLLYRMLFLSGSHPQRVGTHVACGYLLCLLSLLPASHPQTRLQAYFHPTQNVTLIEWEMYVGVFLRRLVMLSGTWRTNILCFFPRVRKEEILWKRHASCVICVDCILHYVKATWIF